MTYMYEIDFNMKHMLCPSMVLILVKILQSLPCICFNWVFLHVHAPTNKWNLIKKVYINLKVSQMLHRGNLRAHVE